MFFPKTQIPLRARNSKLRAMIEHPPVAVTESFVRSIHSDAVVDPYHWMADKGDSRFLEYLTAENAYTEASTSHLDQLRQQIYTDIVTRTRQTDMTVPTWVTHTDGSAWWYFARTVEGLDYPRHCRIAGESRDFIPDVTEPLPNEQVLLDLNLLAEGQSFASLGWAEVSPDGRRLAYSIDTSGDERYDLWITDLTTGMVVDGPIRRIGPGGAWLGDERVVYCRVDAAWRPFEVWRHRVGDETDTRIFAEEDEAFWVGVDGSRDRQWVLIELASKTSTECHLLPTDDPEASPRCIAPRRAGVEYIVEVATDSLFVLHNDGAPQFELCQAPLESTSASDWTTLVPQQPQTRLTDVDAYDHWLVVQHRTDGMTGVTILPRLVDGSLGEPRQIRFDEEIYEIGADSDAAPDTDRIRLSFESLARPAEVIEYMLETGDRRVLRRLPVLDHPTAGPFDSSQYVTERLWAAASDETQIPISIVRHKDTPVDQTSPCLLYGYGSYEISVPLTFSIPRLSLLDRGFIFAIAHVRGGGEMGRPWYDAGKLMSKRNTFTDFISCGEHLVASGYSHPNKLMAEGGSAGGLLMGAVANMQPELFRAIHASVPFVDTLTTILNPDLPLTVIEWEEWGDPLHDASVYEYMKSYSPYENIECGEYPAILATTSLNDTRVEVTEPAKWIARLRTCATNGADRPILLRTEMIAGHGGASARYHAWRDRAFELAWLVDQAS